MTTTTINFDNTDFSSAWLAGYISINGSFMMVKTGGTTPAAIRYVTRSSNRKDAIERFAELTDTNAKAVGDATQVSVQGRVLHEVMTNVWPHLTRERKREYAALRKALKA